MGGNVSVGQLKTGSIIFSRDEEKKTNEKVDWTRRVGRKRNG